MSFDIRAKENKSIVEYLKAAPCLIVDLNGSSRSTVRKMLSDMGATTAKVDTAENFEEALQKIEKLKPTVLFTDYNLGKDSGITLFEKQKSVCQDPLKSICIVLSEKNSAMVTSAVADADADALIVKPFTYSSFQEKFIEVIQSKVNPSNYFKLIDEGKKLLQEKKLDEALKRFGEAKPLDPKPSVALYFEGHTLVLLEKPNEAKKSFEEGLKHNPSHYKCLFGLFDLLQKEKAHEKSYELATTISKHYPIPPKRIPEFIHLSMQNHKYEDVLSYYEVFQTIDPPDDMLITYLSAAFVVCGKFYLRHEKPKEALDALKRAQLLCRGRAGILKEIVITLMEANQVHDAETLLGQMPDEVKNSPEIGLLFFNHLLAQGAVDQALKTGLALIDKGVKDLKLFETVVEHSKATKRTALAMDDLLAKAIKAFPDKKEYFEKLIKG